MAEGAEGQDREPKPRPESTEVLSAKETTFRRLYEEHQERNEPKPMYALKDILKSQITDTEESTGENKKSRLDYLEGLQESVIAIISGQHPADQEAVAAYCENQKYYWTTRFNTTHDNQPGKKTQAAFIHDLFETLEQQVRMYHKPLPADFPSQDVLELAA